MCSHFLNSVPPLSSNHYHHMLHIYYFIYVVICSTSQSNHYRHMFLIYSLICVVICSTSQSQSLSSYAPHLFPYMCILLFHLSIPIYAIICLNSAATQDGLLPLSAPPDIFSDGCVSYISE